MALITEMNLSEWTIKGIISDYRKLLKVDEALSGSGNSTFINLLSFIEDMLPAYVKEKKEGEICEGYYTIREMVLSDMDEDALINVLLCVNDDDGKTHSDNSGVFVAEKRK